MFCQYLDSGLPTLTMHAPFPSGCGERLKQGLAKHGLNYVIVEYLPRKMANVELFLP